MASESGLETGEPRSNSGRVRYIHLGIVTPGKGMSPSSSPAMD